MIGPPEFALDSTENLETREEEITITPNEK